MVTKERASARTRVSLTARDLSGEAGIALLQRLEQVWTDGVVSEHDVAGLSEWLREAAAVADLPGVHFLREEVAGILADGIVSEPEKRLLRDAILRVFPVTERERARARFAESAAKARKTRKEEQEKQQQMLADRATQAQLDYIAALGGTCADGTSKAEASGIIGDLLASRPTVRQRMVLRFWNRLDLNAAGVDGVSAWLDQWYAEDPDRSEAWALWKREAGDQGQRTPDRVEVVPLGEGERYLALVKAQRGDAAKNHARSAESASTTRPDHPGNGGRTALLWAGGIALVGVILWLLS